MKVLIFLSAFFFLSSTPKPQGKRKIIDVHLHGSQDVNAQIQKLKQAGVYAVAISSSWEIQEAYRSQSGIKTLFGLMFPCPNGKVPYSLQPCFTDGKDWPPVSWVEKKIVEGKIDFFGEILSQYYGISSSDTLLFPYYELAEKYNLPVGIHTGGAGPDHGSPDFKMEMGNPLLMNKLIKRFPRMKVWIMHSGDQFYEETIRLMKENSRLYADLSVISNPMIVPSEKFETIMKDMLSAGLENRIMFGTDNGDVERVISAIERLAFLTDEQKEKIYFRNAEVFFGFSE